MDKTMDLFARAVEKQTAASWARELNIDRAALSMAKKRGRLAPAVAGYLAMKLGEDPEHWISVAALEAEPDNELLTRLRKDANSWRKRRDSNPR
ncbi:MAG: hypothetical protein EPN61_12045 [Burkholderiaceae bacterium]|nr:MAG: hypothetical protein EPN61_12045 [Burkholderiaceae bacterium]